MCVKIGNKKVEYNYTLHRMLGLIKRSYTFLDKDSLLCLYNAMVRPIMEYGVTIWSPYRKGDIEAVESVQRRAIRILYNTIFSREEHFCEK